MKRVSISSALVLLTFLQAACSMEVSRNNYPLLKQLAAASSTGGTVAKFNQPVGMTTVGSNLYVVDSQNHTIRKIVIATGVVSTFAGSPGIAGSADGTGRAATFQNPVGITSDGTNLFVADSTNHTIRKIVIATGVVTTVAGTAGTVGYLDAAGGAAMFSSPVGITTDGTNLYVADSGNHSIRQIDIATGTVTTLAGTGAVGMFDAIGVGASFFAPQGITTDGWNLFVADTGNNLIRQIVIASASVTTLAGIGSPGFMDGVGVTAWFNQPLGITMDPLNLYVADSMNHSIRKIVISTGTVSTLAGTNIVGTTDGTGNAARFNSPYGILNLGTNLYVADSLNHTLRKVDIATAAVTTYKGTPGLAGSSDGL